MIRNKMFYKSFKLAALLASASFLAGCASSSENEGSCVQKYRLSAEGKSVERCMNAGGIAVFQGEAGTFVDCKFQPADGKPVKTPGSVSRPGF